MKRRTLALLMGAVMAFGLTACGGSSAPAEDSTEESEQVEQIEEESAGLPSEGEVGAHHVALTRCEFNTDYDGNNIIIVNYDFTNNSEETMSPLVGVYIQAFQDGIELEHGFVMDTAVCDVGIEQKEIKPGATLTGCQTCFVLTSESQVEIEVSDIISDPTVGAIYEVEQ